MLPPLKGQLSSKQLETQSDEEFPTLGRQIFLVLVETQILFGIMEVV